MLATNRLSWNSGYLSFGHCLINVEIQIMKERIALIQRFIAILVKDRNRMCSQTESLSGGSGLHG